MKRQHIFVTNSIFLLFFFCAISSIKAQVEPGSTAFVAAVDSIFADKADMKSPGASVIVLKGKDVILSKNYGSANLTFEVPFSEHTIFPLSNLTDQLVAFSILQLAKKKALKLTDPVNKYLPEFGFHNEISLAHLLNHSSGLPMIASVRLMAGWNFPDPIYHDDFLSLTKAFAPDLKPNADIRHDHAGLKILQMVVEKVSEMNFSEYASTHIFQPLGMTSSFVKNGHFNETQNNAIGYEEADGIFERAQATVFEMACPITYSTQSDFEKWMLNFQTKKFEGDIIEKMDESLSLKGEPQKRENRAYCMGQHQYFRFLGEDEFYLLDVHDGYSWKWVRLKQSDVSIMVIGNVGSYIGSKVNAIAGLLVSPAANSDAAEEPAPTPIKMSEKELKAYTGSYWDTGYLFATEVSIRDGGLYYTDLDNGWHFPLTPLSKSMFGEPSGNLIEITDLNGKPKLTLTLNSGMKFYSDKYDAAISEKMDRSRYTGVYHSDKLNAFFQLVIEDNKLILKRSRKPDLELIPIDKNKFRTAEIDFRLIEFQEDAGQVISQMTISNTIVKNIEFQRLR
ncbi:MAG: serine hydrolase [Bacteroidia bacterium]